MEKGKKLLIAVFAVVQSVLLVGMIFLVVQNRSLAEDVKQYVASVGDVHEIYDDSKVVEAYKSGKTDGLDEQEKFVLDTAKKVIKENIKDGMTDYEKEKAIYDWQVKYVSMNDQNMAPISAGDQYSHTPYGVLKYHSAICVGNATTFKLFMDILGIDCKIIHSTQEGEHAWDLVKLDDDWYHVDVTFDGGTNGNPDYSYFNVPDSVKDDGSYPWNHDEIPAADGTKYCLVANEAKELKDVYAIPKYMKKRLADGKTLISFSLKDSKGYTTNVADYLATAMNDGSGDLYAGTTYAIGNKNIYTFTLSKENSGSESGEVSQKVIDKLQEIIDGIQ